MLDLISMGCMHIKIIDFDEVTPSNYSNQIFKIKHFGRKKVDCLKELIEFIGCEGKFQFKDAKVDENYDVVDFESTDQIIILALDNMEGRKLIAEESFLLSKGLLLDTRLGKEFATGIAIKLDNLQHINAYRKTYLFDDADAEPALCTEKTYAGVSTWCAQFIVNAVWSYCVKDMKDFPQVTNIHCDTQRTSYAKF